MNTADLLMNRALRYALDQHNLTVEALKTIPGKLKNMLEDLAIAIADDMRYNSLKYFRLL